MIRWGHLKKRKKNFSVSNELSTSSSYPHYFEVNLTVNQIFSCPQLLSYHFIAQALKSNSNTITLPLQYQRLTPFFVSIQFPYLLAPSQHLSALLKHVPTQLCTFFNCVPVVLKHASKSINDITNITELN